MNKTNHPPRGKLVEIKCARCKKPRRDYAGDLKGNKSFCSPACSAAYYHAKAGHGGPETVKCGYCRAPRKIFTSQKRDNNFCNRECYFLWRANGMKPAKRTVK